MLGVNKAIIVGTLGRDPEIRTMQNSGRIATFSVATTQRWTSNGEPKERTEWHRIVIYNEQLCDVAERFLKKGSKVYLEGVIQGREYIDKDGVKRNITEIVLNKFGAVMQLLGDPLQKGAHDGGGYKPPPQKRQAAAPSSSKPSWEPGGGDLDDEIPFAPEFR